MNTFLDAIGVLKREIVKHEKDSHRPHELTYPIQTPERMAEYHRLMKENFEEAISVLEKNG